MWAGFKDADGDAEGCEIEENAADVVDPPKQKPKTREPDTKPKTFLEKMSEGF